MFCKHCEADVVMEVGDTECPVCGRIPWTEEEKVEPPKKVEKKKTK
jgi:uncharacterized Zn finger protein (UPF0148 family)